MAYQFVQRSSPAENAVRRAGEPPTIPRLLGIFRSSRLWACGGAIAVLYGALLAGGYRHGHWPVDGSGVPTFSDFTTAWAVGHAALRGHAALAYNPAEFIKLQRALIGPHPVYMPYWPYPPVYLLILAPLAALRYLAAFMTFETTTLLACIAVVVLITRRSAAIALVLALPFTMWNFVCGQTGFLTASLVGAALLALERRPVLAGVFLGWLTCKPQFGILFPVALIAAREWRAIAGAAVTTVLIAAASIAAFGAAGWAEFPGQLLAQGGFNLMAASNSYWGLLHTAYGTTRYLGGGAALAWAAQAITTSGVAAIVWLAWRAPVRHALKAAVLSAGVLLATPYALAYDMAALAVAAAFLARDQIEHGLLKAEQTTLLAMFAVSFAVIPTVGRAPIGLPLALALLALAMRRIGQASPRGGWLHGPPETPAPMAPSPRDTGENISETIAAAKD